MMAMGGDEFKEFLEVQLEEINKYKWIRSEQEGHDIGRNCACNEWIAKGYAKQFRIRWEQTHPPSSSPEEKPTEEQK